jgi:putative peptidoglycan lipid II flippase
MIVVTGLLAVVGMLFAAPLVRLYAGDFDAVPGKLELTIRLTRIMFPFLVLVSVAAVLMGMLNALHRFFIPALSPAMFNVATIVCAVALVPFARRVGMTPITMIAAGTLAGGAGQVLLQWPALRREGFRYAPLMDLHDEDLRHVARLMGPGIAGLAAVQVNLFINSWLATRLGTGAVSWLDYAFRLMYMPIGLFGISIATASLPGISRHAAVSDDPGVRHSVSAGLRMMLMLNVPATAGLAALATPIVKLIYEHGLFTPADTSATAAALMCYAPRAHRLLRGEADFPVVLRARQQPHPGDGQCGERDGERGAEPGSRQHAGAPWACAWHGTGRPGQRRDPVRAAGAAPRRVGRHQRVHRRLENLAGIAGNGSGRVPDGAMAARAVSR